MNYFNQQRYLWHNSIREDMFGGMWWCRLRDKIPLLNCVGIGLCHLLNNGVT